MLGLFLATRSDVAIAAPIPMLPRGCAPDAMPRLPVALVAALAWRPRRAVRAGQPSSGRGQRRRRGSGCHAVGVWSRTGATAATRGCSDTFSGVYAGGVLAREGAVPPNGDDFFFLEF